MFSNAIKAATRQNRPVLNGWLSIGNPFTAEIMSKQGYDFLTVDLQHGALGYAEALTMLQVIAASPVTPMVRVPSNEPGIIMKCLDAGAQAVICPMVNTVKEAERFVGSLYYPPRGYRSSGPTRAAVAYGGYGLEANDEIMGFAMIETREGVENVAEIATTPGLSGIYIGPSDLTLTTQAGRYPPGFDREEPEMLALLQDLLGVCKEAGILAGLHCGTPAYAARAIAWGFDLTTVSGDTRLLSAAASASVSEWRQHVGHGAQVRSTNTGGY